MSEKGRCGSNAVLVLLRYRPFSINSLIHDRVLFPWNPMVLSTSLPSLWTMKGGVSSSPNLSGIAIIHVIHAELLVGEDQPKGVRSTPCLG